MRVAQLEESGGLLGTLGVDRPAKVGGIVGDQADRVAVDAGERRDDAGGVAVAQLHTAVDIDQRVQYGPHVVDLQPVLRDEVAQNPLIGDEVGVRLDRPLEVAQVAAGSCNGGSVVGHPNVDDAVGVLGVDRADVLRGEGAQAPTLDHRRAAHADVGVLGGDHHVAAAQQGGIARKAATRCDADERHGSRQAAEQVERHRVQARYRGGVGVARPAAAPLSEEHHRQAPPLGQLEESILFPVVLIPLGAGQHHVVVGQHHRSGPVGSDRLGSDRGQAADQAVGGGAFDQVVDAATLALGGDHQRSVLDE